MPGPTTTNWITTHRPSSLADMWLEPETRGLLKGWLRMGRCQSLLLGGPRGVGKTTVAKILTEALAAETKWMNSSAERGIDVVRDEIRPFASRLAPTAGMRMVVFEEADRLTPEAQDALREIIEGTSAHTAFVAVANRPKETLTEPFRDRFQMVEMPPVPAEERARLLSRILERENVTCPPSVVDRLARSHNSMRVVLHEAERLAVIHAGEIPPETKLAPHILETVEAVSELTDGTDEGVTQAAMVDRLGLAKSTVSDRVRKAVDAGLVADQNDRPGTAASLVVTECGQQVVNGRDAPNVPGEAA